MKISIRINHPSGPFGYEWITKSEILKCNLPLFSVDKILRNKTFDIEVDIKKKKNSLENYIMTCNISDNTLQYVVSFNQIIKDLQKIVLQILALKGAKNDFFFIHAAALLVNNRAVLIPGYSGTGKSTLSYDWNKNFGIVLSSEITVIRNNAVIDGNRMISIKKKTVKAHIDSSVLDGLVINNEYIKEKTFWPKNRIKQNYPISFVVFPKILQKGWPIQVYPISKLRARMTLYEDSFWIINGGFLLGEHKVAGLSLSFQEDLQKTANFCSQTTELPMMCIEGGARQINSWIEAFQVTNI
jgi:hypothetical protein